MLSPDLSTATVSFGGQPLTLANDIIRYLQLREESSLRKIGC